ncbi:hypothetical protein ABZ800_10005 [Streptomyces sp. NPDC047813]|uniref:hypothetical protein n=1 Tax=Streptomyces sp. NPDC047813 TaxID=3154608 RepID=UPI0033EEE272
MSDDETSGRSLARAHLSQLIELFGTDGCLRISTGSSAPDPAAVAAEPEGDERT